jgi:hypothetical protein
VPVCVPPFCVFAPAPAANPGYVPSNVFFAQQDSDKAKEGSDDSGASGSGDGDSS